MDFFLEGEGDMIGVWDGEDGRKDGMILCDCGCELLEFSIILFIWLVVLELCFGDVFLVFGFENRIFKIVLMW